jgi:ketosteroid isomerase-like protein
MEALVDKDSTGTLWATYTQGDKVFVTHTTTSDTTWLTPYETAGAWGGEPHIR